MDEENKNLPDLDDRGINVLSKITVSVEEVKDIIFTLDREAVGPDTISNIILITVKKEIALPLSYVFLLTNRSRKIYF